MRSLAACAEATLGEEVGITKAVFVEPSDEIENIAGWYDLKKLNWVIHMWVGSILYGRIYFIQIKMNTSHHPNVFQQNPISLLGVNYK